MMKNIKKINILIYCSLLIPAVFVFLTSQGDALIFDVLFTVVALLYIEVVVLGIWGKVNQILRVERDFKKISVNQVDSPYSLAQYLAPVSEWIGAIGIGYLVFSLNLIGGIEGEVEFHQMMLHSVAKGVVSGAIFVVLMKVVFLYLKRRAKNEKN
ncbi:hypothetical protein [Halobacteriovorax sp. CON-3]|uniref:hypothetical protein n=1 Tax=Halobacteriovorax sp. CON-3 TaxID=3157710 RepID=UPI0037176865